MAPGNFSLSCLQKYTKIAIYVFLNVQPINGSWLPLKEDLSRDSQLYLFSPELRAVDFPCKVSSLMGPRERTDFQFVQVFLVRTGMITPKLLHVMLNQES